MAERIQFFGYIQNTYRTVGIDSLQIRQSTRFGSFNWRNPMALFVITIMFAASTSFLLFEANSFQQYGDSFWICVSFLVYIVGMTATISKMSNIFILFEKFDEFVEKSENRKCSKGKFCRIFYIDKSYLL